MAKLKTNTNFEGYGLRPIRTKSHRIKHYQDCEFNSIDILPFDVRKIDIVAFVAVGVLFICFNVIYWTNFLGFDSLDNSP